MVNGEFKGGSLVNRYKITGTLTTRSPLHIGDGGMMSDPSRLTLEDDNGGEVKFTTVVTDVRDRAYIPGSTLKGNMRAWATQIFTPLDLACVNDGKRAATLRDAINDKRSPGLTLAERLFGSAVNEGKLEFWDAPMLNPPQISQDQRKVYLAYDGTRGTIILKSVAIDPATGTAAEKKLYNYEVVPEGAKFKLTISGQNLSDEELGMLIFTLEGFNSEIYPVTLGAMRSIGFGRFSFDMQAIYCLNQENLTDWLDKAIQSGHAGYEGLKQLSQEEQGEKIKNFKEKFSSAIKAEEK